MSRYRHKSPNISSAGMPHSRSLRTYDLDGHHGLSHRRNEEAFQKGRLNQKTTKTATKQSSNEGSADLAANGGSVDEEEDGNANAEEEDDSEEPDNRAPFNKPSTNAGLARKVMMHHRGTGPRSGKKRTFSSIRSDSSSQGSEDSDHEPLSVPRRRQKKIARRRTYSALDRNRVTTWEFDLVESFDAMKEDIEISDNDDDYAAVELVSDSDEEAHANVEKAEQKGIVESNVVDSADEASTARRLSLVSADSDLLDFELDANTIFDDKTFFDAEFHRGAIGEASDLASTTAAKEQDRKSFNVSSRRVRFNDEIQLSEGSSTVESDQESDIYPDIMLQQDHLDPGFRRVIENEQDFDVEYGSGSDSDSSYWDFRGDEGDGGFQGFDDVNEDSNQSDSSAGSSGYETDEGETTDEDSPISPTVSNPKSLLRQQTSPALGEESDVVTSKPTPNSSMQPPRIPASAAKRRGPVMGTWAVDPNKAFAVIDHTGTRMLITPARHPSNNDLQLWSRAGSSVSSPSNSPQASFQNLAGEESDLSDMSAQQSSMYLDPALRQLFGAATGSGLSLGKQALIGGTDLRAFYPFTNVGVDGSVIEDEDEWDDASDHEDQLDINAFIDLGDDSENDDVEVSDEGTPAASSTQNSTSNLLAHFDKGFNIMSFAHNQHRAHHHASLPQSPAMRKLTSDEHAVQVGRAAAANALITPRRKRRTGTINAHSHVAHHGSPLKHGSPLNGGPARGTFGGRRH
ncbi:hypothetical protein B0A49_07254 [Cryomyces minteri]|uniref:Uncharacterized protein n=1 Tax=Cryomyces minteri TaxID=331657 RepID=A0A4U0X4J3_9PEZI|nr:hypothetical protein B0A49_07254 [Cryomyces minteri]